MFDTFITSKVFHAEISIARHNDVALIIYCFISRLQKLLNVQAAHVKIMQPVSTSLVVMSVDVQLAGMDLTVN